jgi:hypothetical protein
VVEHRESFERAGQAVLSKIMSHEGAAAALQEGMKANVALNSPNAPDLNKAGRGAEGEAGLLGGRSGVVLGGRLQQAPAERRAHEQEQQPAAAVIAACIAQNSDGGRAS